MIIKDMESLRDQAIELAEQIRNDLGNKPVVIGLSGPLGAGKTTFSKFFISALVSETMVTSPTYVLHVPYKLPSTVIDHLDVYRLETEDELERLKIDDLIKDRHIILIEWADKFRQQIYNKCRTSGAKLYWITLQYELLEEQRKMTKEIFGATIEKL